MQPKVKRRFGQFGEKVPDFNMKSIPIPATLVQARLWDGCGFHQNRITAERGIIAGQQELVILKIASSTD
jgi:hypothetical protein